MSKIVYTLKEKENTAELHLFEAESSIDNKCTPNNKSICNKMSKSESKKNVFACESEKTARLECAKIGRQVCGTCISYLYSDFK